MSKAFILVGSTGCGKTYFTKQLLKTVHKNALLIFDVNNEWKEYYPYPFDADIDKFLEKANKVRKGVILIEDATAFLSNRGRSDLLTKILVAKRHTQNTIILLFHSMRSIPKYIVDISTHIVIFKTNDPLTLVEKAFENEKITEAFERVQTNAKNHPFWSQYPPPTGIAPPSEIVSLY
jgi:ATPase family associated with various cellular activities (AAA).